MSGWPHYPPCAGGSCTDITCCAHGHKSSWPELFGKKEAEAQATIQRDNPDVTVVILPPGRVGLPDFCCNRVFVTVDASGNVTNTPTVG
ncbi:hypothetical protein V6N13_075292 [Hibiscus sabdariffa]|uniref:Uncharacterized protein n=1 Tax=Hibiscus sabdariffa TaxID=183260 RepID=A0ABR2UB33_9ROSI